MIGALWILTTAVALLVLELWRLHSRVDKLTEVHTKHLATIQALLRHQNQRDDRVAKILAIMCGLWPRGNDAIVRQWAADVAADRENMER